MMRRYKTILTLALLTLLYPIMRFSLSFAQQPPPPKVDYEAWFNNTIKDNYFDTAATKIRPDAREILTSDAQALQQHPNVKFVIQGHTDERGSDAYNDRLSAKRAASARSFLVAHGVAPNQISTSAEGKKQQVCTEHDDDCWQKNRRDHLVFSASSE